MTSGSMFYRLGSDWIFFIGNHGPTTNFGEKFLKLSDWHEIWHNYSIYHQDGKNHKHMFIPNKESSFWSQILKKWSHSRLTWNFKPRLIQIHWIWKSTFRSPKKLGDPLALWAMTSGSDGIFFYKKPWAIYNPDQEKIEKWSDCHGNWYAH